MPTRKWCKRVLEKVRGTNEEKGRKLKEDNVAELRCSVSILQKETTRKCDESEREIGEIRDEWTVKREKKKSQTFQLKRKRNN